MQEPISETILVSQNLVNWFLNPVSKVIALHAMLNPINSIHFEYILKKLYFKSSEFCSSLLVIESWILTRSELAGFEVCMRLSFEKNNNCFKLRNFKFTEKLFNLESDFVAILRILFWF